jgi:tRNA nucleotidyltransferase (CCA-adding enzyme)
MTTLKHYEQFSHTTRTFDRLTPVDDNLMLKINELIEVNKHEFKIVKFRKNFDLVSQKLKEVEEKDKVRNFQPPITGEIIMEIFQLQPCAEIGLLKTKIKDAILEGIIPNEYSAAYDYMLELATEIGLSKINN